jgi:hypothetical protein
MAGQLFEAGRIHPGSFFLGVKSGSGKVKVLNMDKLVK